MTPRKVNCDTVVTGGGEKVSGAEEGEGGGVAGRDGGVKAIVEDDYCSAAVGERNKEKPRERERKRKKKKKKNQKSLARHLPEA